MKVVLDTNVLIAAFITHGLCSELLEHCLRQHKLVTSDFILDEFQKYLVGKFKYGIAEAAEAVELLRPRMEVTTPAVLEGPVCRDPSDDNIIGTAIAGDAACIVTGDRDLLVLKRFGAVDIISPAGFSAYEGTKQLGP